MSLTRIVGVTPLEPFRLRLALSDGREVERDVAGLLVGPVFEAVRRDKTVFAAVRIEGGTVVWPNGADLCPDVLIWGGLPPADEDRPKISSNVS
jgi:hypothetical protein